MARWLGLLPAIGLLLGTGLGAAAQGPSVEARIEPPGGIVPDRSFRLVIRVTDAGRSRITPPGLPEIENLTVLGGPNTSTSFTWTNGRSTSSYELAWLLLAERPGWVEIPSLEISIDSRPYPTNPMRFEVKEAGKSPALPPRGGDQLPGVQPDAVFLRAELGQQEAWVGQAVPLTVTLLTTVRIHDAGWVRQPEFSSFWVESQEVRPDDEAYRTRVDGQIYTAYPFERKLLIPSGPGVFEIEPYVARMGVRLPGRNFFDIFGRSETVVRSSETLSLRVRELPVGAPEGFGGAVGSFTLEAELDRTESNVDDAVALRVTVEGEGSLRSVDPPRFRPPPELTVFDPKVSAASSVSAGTLRSRKTWEWILVPLAEGEIRLPEIEFDYFDPHEGSYQSARSGAMQLLVQRGRGSTERPVAGRGIQPQQQDLIFIKTARGRLKEARPRAHQRGSFFALALAPLALLPLVVVVGRHRARMQRDLGLARARRAGSRARKRLAAARKHLEQADSASFHEEVARALVEYVADRFNRSATGLTYDLADDLLALQEVDTSLRQRYRSCLETCDFARFVPASGKSERRAEVLKEALQMLGELERAW